MVFMAVTVVGLAAMSVGLLSINLSVEKEQREGRRDLTSFYAAEAGLSLAFQDVLNGGDGALGTEGSPLTLGNANYFVESTDLGGSQTSLVATGMVDGGITRAELVLVQSGTGLFQYAAFGDDGVLLNSAALIDSYDSGAGDYASQFDGGTGHAGENGHVGSNLDIVMEANTDIYGNVSPGPTGILDDNPPQTHISGTTSPLASEYEFPAVVTPSYSPSPSISTSTDLVITGDHYFPSIDVGTGDLLTIVGPAIIVTDDFELSSNSDLVIDATAGEVEIYSSGDFILRSNCTVTTLADTALDISVYLTADNWGPDDDGSEIDLRSNSEFIGTIYAPDAYLDINSNFELFGGMIGDYIELSSNSEIHYDEALATGGSGGSFVFNTLLWRPLGDE